MREIKFRSWLKERKEFIYDFVMDSILNSENERCIVSQYAGRKDIDGLDIYEGDILQSDYYPCSPEDDYVLVVEYEDGCFWATKRLKADATARGISDGMAEPLHELRGTEFKVIGNIYENPELLKEETE